LLIPTGSVHDAKLTGSVVKDVKCAFCHNQYFFVLTRTGEGRETAPLFIGQDDARRKATAKAHDRLAFALRFGVDAVSCPNCGKYQPRMVEAARDLRMSVKKIMTITVVVLVLAMAGAAAVVDDNTSDALAYSTYLIPIAVLVGLALYRDSIDPNRDASSRIGMNAPGPARFKSREQAEAALSRP
jgi:hypothetical protein